jgi:hypothetical protein
MMSSNTRPAPAWLDLLRLAGILLAAFFVAQAAMLALAAAFGIPIEALADFPSFAQKPESMWPLLALQSAYATVLFVGTPWAFGKMWPGALPAQGAFRLPLLLAAMAIVLAYLPLSAALVHWNESLRLPEAWAELEASLRAQEADMQAVTKAVTRYASPGQALAVLAVIALLPGIGEEWLFRGRLQPILSRLFGNPHAGIWVTALVFSAFHLQFYGLVPRWVLGVLFGYLYYWSGRIEVSMAAHFFNNAFTVCLMWALGDIEQATSNVGWLPAGVSALASGAMLWRFRKAGAAISG